MAELMSTLRVNENDYTIKDAAAWSRIDDLYAIKESLANKVTSIDQDSTDTEYPSAKCVYDALENSQLFFKCVFRQTLYQDIANAITAGKIPYLIHDSILMFLCTYNIPASGTNRYVDFGFGFNADDGNLLGRIRVNYQETWSFLRFVKTQTIDSASTNSQLPTAKSVYDALQARTLYWHDIMLNKASGSSEPDFSVRVRLLLTSNTQITSATAFRDVMVNSQGRYVPIAASGSAYNSSNERINVLQVSAEELSFSYVGTMTFYGINENLGAWETRTMTCTNNDFSVTDTVVGVW